jgi:hypothetical protein
MFIRERNIFVGTGSSLVNATGENRLHTNVPKRIGERVGMSELPAVFECAIGSSSGLLGKAAMPERPRQIHEGANADVLAVASGEFAMRVGPVQ